MSEFLVEVSRHNPGLARSLRALRRRAESAVRDAAIADTVLDARDAAPGADPDSAATGSRSKEPVTASASGEPFASTPSLADSPLRTLRALDTTTITPLAELEALALRSARALGARRSRQRLLIIAVGVLASAQLGVAAYLATTGSYVVSALLLVITVVLVAFAHTMFRPFERARRTQQLRRLADTMMHEVRTRLAMLEGLDDISARQLTQWKAVLDLTEGISER